MARSWYPVIDYGKCNSCHTCVEFCPHDVYALGERSEPVVVNPDGCVARCRNCAKRCAAEAISYFGDSTVWQAVACQTVQLTGGTLDEATIKSEVRKRYAGHARSGGCNCGCSCGGSEADVTRLVDYTELAQDVVAGSELGLGCGLPTRHAALRSGETVLDLGSGAGVDAFIAAKAVGSEGRVIGVDMTPEMIARARANARQSGLANVDFRLGEIEAMPVESGTVDVVLSNCVINLVPDKRVAFAEIRRVLREGGRFCISDVVSFGDVPQSVRRDVELWAGCIAGAMDRDAYLQLIREAGFDEVAIAQQEQYSQFGGDGYGFASVTLTGVKG